MVKGVVCKTSRRKIKITGHSHSNLKYNIFDDVEVPLYPTLVKTIVKRYLTASDTGKREALVNAARGLSPLTMLYSTE